MRRGYLTSATSHGLFRDSVRVTQCPYFRLRNSCTPSIMTNGSKPTFGSKKGKRRYLFSACYHDVKAEVVYSVDAI